MALGMKRFFLMIGILIHFFAVSAFAEIKPGSLEGGLFGGHYWFEDDQQLKDGLVVGLRLGYAFTPHIALEGSFERPRLDSRSVDVRFSRLTGLYHFNPGARFVPFIEAGAGSIRVNDLGSLWTGNAGAGIKYFLTKNIVLRGDILSIIHEGDAYVSRTKNYEATVGLSYVWQKKGAVLPPTAPPVRPAVRVAPPPAPVVVVPPPPPAPVVVAPPATCPPGQTGTPPNCVTPPPPDSDNDGVPDALDLCPNTPAGVAVNKDGCPLDSDGDGVSDMADQCPNTPMGTSVDSKGCPPPPPAPVVVVPKVVTYPLDVKFDVGTATIRHESEANIKAFASLMKQHPEGRVEIQGHTDNTGDAKYNVTLSQKRADSVMKALIASGAVADHLSAKGFGGEQPIGDNATREGKQLNRRVAAKMTVTE